MSLLPSRTNQPSIRSSSTIISIVFGALLFWCWLIQSIDCYIPALPSNDSLRSPPTTTTTTNSNASSSSPLDPNWIIQLNWHPIGIFSDGITHQLKSDSSNRTLYQGVLLHFSEFNATSQPPAVVPWIAMINCDSNSTNFSIQDDIFTLARDRGAAAAMLYSLTSQSCQVNQEYLQNFEKPLDVFSAANLQGARLIESQFSNVLGAGYWFQSSLLNSSAPTILQQIKSLGLSNLTDFSARSSPSTDSTSPTSPGSSTDRQLADASDDGSLAKRSQVVEAPVSDRSSTSSNRLIARSSDPHSLHLKLNMNVSRHRNGSVTNDPPIYLIATLANADVVGSLDQQRQDRNRNPSAQTNPDGGNNSNTGLAMIVLYAITGCVSFMFLIVIVSGAIRAIRNPDRYGPRPGRRVDPQTGEEDPYAPPRQTRAEGLGKAILDTFPIVKFGRQRNAARLDSPGAPDHSDLLKAQPTSVMIDEENIMMRERDPIVATDGAVPLTGLSSNKSEPDGVDSYRSPTSRIPLMCQTRQSSTSSSSDMMLQDNTLSASQPHSQDWILSDPPQLLSPVDGPLHHEDTAQTSSSRQAQGGEETTAVADSLAEVNNSMTCPICVCDFEDDDDIRMLPCDARHQFHKECVDPWLLNESKFCPLCRWDLTTRKDGTKITTELVEAQFEEPSTPVSPRQVPTSLTSPLDPSSVHLTNGSLGDLPTQGRGQTTEASSHLPRSALAPWLSFRNRSLSLSRDAPSSTQGRHSLDSQNQNRTNYLFSLVPHALKRRGESQPGNSASEAVVGNDQSTSDQHLPSSHSQMLSNDQEESISRGRFFKYLGQIRRKRHEDHPDR